MALERVVLCLSGGLDSSILAASFRSQAEIVPLFFDYGQSPLLEERRAARAVASTLGLEPPIELSLPNIPRLSGLGESFFACRNLIFAAHASAIASSIGSARVLLGFVADTDPTLYPDATPGFCKKATELIHLTLGSAGNVGIYAPFANVHKAELVVEAMTMGFDTRVTYSCYHAGGRCGECSSCRAAINAFDRAASIAPTRLRPQVLNANPYFAPETAPA